MNIATMTRIILVDDEINIREGLRRIINRSPSFEVLADFSDGKEALEWLTTNATDIVLSDIRMPEMDGIALSQEISIRWPHTQVILLTGHAEFNYAHAAIKAGVVDYILKPCDPAIILETLRKAARSAPIPPSKPDAVQAVHPVNNSDAKQDEDLWRAQYGIETRNPSIRAALQYVLSNYEQELTVRDVASYVHLSTSYFSTLFKEETAHNLSHFIHLVRIEQSKQLLANLQYKSYEVAELVGYKTFRHFNEIFKLMTGHTPSEYRRSIQHIASAVPAKKMSIQ